MNNFTLFKAKLILLTLLFGWGGNICHLESQTMLPVGGAAIIAYNTDDGDEFAFIILRNVIAGTSLSFTDASWQGCDQSAAFRSTELMSGGNLFVVTWTADIAYSAGQIIVFNGNNFSVGTTSGTWGEPSVSGDQIFIFQGNHNSPAFIFGCQFATSSSNDGIVDCPTSANDTNDTNIPGSLSEGSTFIDFGFNRSGSDLDNGYYSGPDGIAPVNFLDALANSSNWTSSNSDVETNTWISEWNSGSSGLLPIELGAFSGKLIEGKIVLEWFTISELNNDYMTIEYSVDGKSFEPLGTVKGAGTTQTRQYYQFIHTNPLAAVNYYRLQQVDFDGKSTFSDLLAIEKDYSALPQHQLFPNPTSDLLNINFSNPSTTKAITILNTVGQVVKNVLLTDYQKNWSIALKELDAGLYIIRIKENKEVATYTIMKK